MASRVEPRATGREERALLLPVAPRMQLWAAFASRLLARPTSIAFFSHRRSPPDALWGGEQTDSSIFLPGRRAESLNQMAFSVEKMINKQSMRWN